MLLRRTSFIVDESMSLGTSIALEELAPGMSQRALTQPSYTIMTDLNETPEFTF